MAELIDKVEQIINIYARITGRKNVIPAHTDLKDTYQWRYITSFISKYESLDVDWDTIIEIAKNVIIYAQKNNMLKNGLWILTRNDAIEMCCETIKKTSSDINSEIGSIKRSYAFLSKNDFNFGNHKKGCFPRIVEWYNSGMISLSYILWSKSCTNALLDLDESDRSMLPSIKIMGLKRVEMMSNNNLMCKIRLIMKNDFSELV